MMKRIRTFSTKYALWILILLTAAVITLLATAFWVCQLDCVSCGIEWFAIGLSRVPETLKYWADPISGLGAIASAFVTIYLAKAVRGEAVATKDAVFATTLRPRLIIRKPYVEGSHLHFTLANNGGTDAKIEHLHVQIIEKQPDLPISAALNRCVAERLDELVGKIIHPGYAENVSFPKPSLLSSDLEVYAVFQVVYSTAGGAERFETGTYRIYQSQTSTFRPPNSVDDVDYVYQY